MKSFINPPFLIGLILLLTISTSAEQSVDVLLSLNFKGNLKIYNSATKEKLIKQVHHNFKDQDFILISIKGEKEEMYKVEVSYAIAGQATTGWIDKNSRLAIFSKRYTGNTTLYNEPNTKLPKTTFGYCANELRIIDVQGKWLKIETTINKKLVNGWLSPSDQCNNPNTTCN